MPVAAGGASAGRPVGSVGSMGSSSELNETIHVASAVGALVDVSCLLVV